MGTSRASCATVILSLLFTSLAHAEPTPSVAPPAVGAQAATAVPIELRGSDPDLRLEIQDPRGRHPLALCTGACQATIIPGRYRFFVNATPDTRPGGREAFITGPSRVLVTARSESQYTTGLALGIAGPVLMVLGSVVFLVNINRSYNEGGSSGSDSGAVAGIGMLLGGMAITPVGWVLFGTSLRPKVEVTPLAR